MAYILYQRMEIHKSILPNPLSFCHLLLSLILQWLHHEHSPDINLTHQTIFALVQVHRHTIFQVQSL